MILCVRSIDFKWTEHETQISHREYAKSSLPSTLKITRLYDYQTWQIHFWGNSRGGQRFVGFFSLIVLFRCWLAGQANSDDMDYMDWVKHVLQLLQYCAQKWFSETRGQKIVCPHLPMYKSPIVCSHEGLWGWTDTACLTMRDRARATWLVFSRLRLLDEKSVIWNHVFGTVKRVQP